MAGSGGPKCTILLVKRNVFDALISRKVTYQYQKTGIRWKDHIKVVIGFENQKKKFKNRSEY